MISRIVSKLKQNKLLLIGIAATLVVAVVAIILIALPGGSHSSGGKRKGSTNLEGYSDTLPEYTLTQKYETKNLSDGKKTVSYKTVQDPIIQYRDTSGINSLLTSTSNCVTVVNYDYSDQPEAFEADFVSKYLKSLNFNFTEGYKKSDENMETVLSIGTLTDSRGVLVTSYIITARTDTVSVIVIVTGSDDCGYTPSEVAQIREAAFVAYDTLSIADIPTM